MCENKTIHTNVQFFGYKTKMLNIHNKNINNVNQVFNSQNHIEISFSSFRCIHHKIMVFSGNKQMLIIIICLEIKS